MATLTGKPFFITALLTLVLSSAGFAMLHFDLLGYGYTFFIVVPLCIGFFAGQRPGWKMGLIFSVLIGLVAFFYLLITAQLEGLFCVLTLLPLIFLLVVWGAWIGYSIREYFKKRPSKNITLKLSVYPLLVLAAAGTIEKYFGNRYDFGRVESTVFLPYESGEVFDFIKSVDTLNTQKPLLLYLGLAIPLKCILDSAAVGANRTCYFKEGTIDEKVTAIRRGEILKMDVIRYGLPGRKWLKFQEAVYLFRSVNGGTELSRITTYRTELRPRFYWRWWEEQAIRAEHEYVLSDLRERMDQTTHRQRGSESAATDKKDLGALQQ